MKFRDSSKVYLLTIGTHTWMPREPVVLFFSFSSRRRHTSFSRDWSSDVCSSDLATRAMALSTVSTYSTDGIDLLDELGPTVTMVLERDLVDPGSQLPTL